jgi:hypothetical protein
LTCLQVHGAKIGLSRGGSGLQGDGLLQ